MARRAGQRAAGGAGRGRGVPRDERRRQILEVASRMFGERGYAGTSMEAIAEGVGVAKPILYRHFGSKRGLYSACAMRLWQGMGAAIWEGATRPGPPDARLWWGIRGYYEFIGRHRGEWRVMYPELAPGGGGEPAGELAAARRGALEMMGRLFEDAAREEGVPAEIAELATPMAYAFVGAATALAAWWMERPEEPVDAPALRLMGFAWSGFSDLRRGRVWTPPP